MNRCLGTKRDKSPCTVTVEPPQNYCWWHDPANAEVRKQAASKGGKRAGKGRPQQELKDIKERITALADAVENGQMKTGVGAVVNQILNTYLRAITVELQIREQEELITRLEALE